MDIIDKIPSGIVGGTQGIGGIALFLFGMKSMSTGFTQMLGKKTKLAVNKVSDNSAASIATGATIGALNIDDEVILGLLDSKTINLKSALQMNLARGISQPMRNILPWLGVATVSLAIPDEAMKAMILAKFGTLHKNEKVKGVSNIVGGLGMASTGMGMLQGAINNHVDQEFLAILLSKIDSPVASALLGAGVMSIVMRSSVLNSIIAPLVNSGAMPLEQAFAINVGQRATGGMDTMYQSIPLDRDVKRLGVGRLMVGGAGMAAYLIAVSASPEIATMINELIAQVPAFENPMVRNQVFFALHSLVMFGIALPLSGLLAKLLNKIIPDKDPNDRGNKLTRLIQKLKPKSAESEQVV